MFQLWKPGCHKQEAKKIRYSHRGIPINIDTVDALILDKLCQVTGKILSIIDYYTWPALSSMPNRLMVKCQLVLYIWQLFEVPPLVLTIVGDSFPTDWINISKYPVNMRI